GPSIFRAYSTDAGATWTRGTIATGVACCDGQAAWDTFGNLFLVYINNNVDQINVILSTDGGITFSAPVTAGTGSIDQPSIAVGNGSVWIDWNQSGSMVARGAPVTGLGVWGPFNAQQAIPSANGSFGGTAVGPGPTAIPPKLPVADGIACCALNGPQTPRPVTGAPRATMFPF